MLHCIRLLPACSSESGTCVEASGAYLTEAWNVAEPQSEEGSSPVIRGEAETSALQELQQLAEADLRDMEKRVTETETTIRNLKNKILLNSQTIDRLVAYRLLA
ncbi:hypothetical protein, conserved [Eimeria brunetti]|uniref:Uncharacterized protein n=1 Tax=Eimeria brunetti TaxID=51314 RepID=U6LXQ9_9EIME|nr:hypothetical protein, conserved [Eimeria brunetti]